MEALDQLLPVRDRQAEKRARREAFSKAHRAYLATREIADEDKRAEAWFALIGATCDECGQDDALAMHKDGTATCGRCYLQR